MGTSLIFEHVYKEFEGPGCVVNDFDVTVRNGDFVSLVGPTACGKSTLLRLILGLEKADQGMIRFGENGAERPEICSIAFQEPRLLPWLTVRANLVLVAGRKAEKGRIDGLLNMVGLTDFAQAYPKILSGGMAQRASLARALVNEPDVLLLDEPFSAVDALTRMRLQDALIGIYMARPRTTIMVTHDIDEALLSSRQVIVLSGTAAHIVDIVDVNAGYPRDRTDATLFSLKARILRGLGVVAKDQEDGGGI